MSSITLRSGTSSPLTHAQVDANFTNLNNDKAGYVTGEGGAVTQATSKSTAVTLNKKCGTVTMNGAALAADAIVSFTLTNSTIAATDVVVLNHASAGTAGKYALNAQAAAGSASINVTNISAGSLSEAIVIRFAVIKAVTA
tara:strand:+ start:352 stop:774 length:423 start_codon:yes stop_codon:yes gene_type:complete